jgi:hypothetical protein
LPTNGLLTIWFSQDWRVGGQLVDEHGAVESPEP